MTGVEGRGAGARPWTERLRETILVGVIASLFRLLRLTWTFVEADYPDEVRSRLADGKAVVFAHLHEDEWALLGAYCERRMAVLVSLSRDGNMMARFLRRFGFEIVRGSPSRNAVGGFLSLVRRVQELPFKAVSLAVDGPKGPRGQAKRGVSRLAATLEAPIVCGAAHADRAWVFRRSWSKAFVPKPFAKIFIAYGDPLRPPNATEEEAVLLQRVSEGLASAKKVARDAASRQRTGDGPGA